MGHPQRKCETYLIEQIKRLIGGTVSPSSFVNFGGNSLQGYKIFSPGILLFGYKGRQWIEILMGVLSGRCSKRSCLEKEVGVAERTVQMTNQRCHIGYRKEERMTDCEEAEEPGNWRSAGCQ